MVSVKNSKIFSRLFFRKIVLKIMLSYGSERKEVFDDDKNVNFVKSEKKWVFSKGKVFSVKKSKIFASLFFSTISLEIMLSSSLERKEAFHDDKNVNFVKSKKWLFSKPIVSVKKSKIFSSRFLSKIGLEIMLSYGLERKEAF